MSNEFVHLRFHSEYSLMDSCCSLSVVKPEALSRGFSALALTDTSNLSGSIKFYKECIKKEDKDGNKLGFVKPILGSLIYVTEGDLGKHDENDHFPIILMAKTNKGFDNLKRISHISNTTGFNEVSKKSRIDYGILDKYKEDLIMIATDLNGPVHRRLRRRNEEEASKMALMFKDMFADDFYLEVQENNQADQDLVNSGIVEISKNHGIKIVATNDVRYYEKKHYKSHLVLRALDKRKTINSRKFSAIRTDQRYFKTFDEMKIAFKDYPDNLCVLKNTVEVADKCNISFKFGGMRLPDFELPKGFDSDWEYLKHLAVEGLKQKGLYDNKEYAERLEEELFDVFMVNETKGYNFSRYFLIVWDYANHAQEIGGRIGIGRGCFTPDNLVICKNGTKRIEDVTCNDSVLSYDGKYHNVLNTLDYDIDEEIIEIETDDGRKISCTKDHKIHIERYGDLMWVRADEITEDDEIFDIDL